MGTTGKKMVPSRGKSRNVKTRFLYIVCITKLLNTFLCPYLVLSKRLFSIFKSHSVYFNIYILHMQYLLHFVSVKV